MFFIPCSLFDIILGSGFTTEENHSGVNSLMLFIPCSLFNIIVLKSPSHECPHSVTRSERCGFGAENFWVVDQTNIFYFLIVIFY